jgi:hypothetical protein
MKNAVLRAKIQRTIVIDPDSGFRQIWDVTQVVSHRKESYFRAHPLFPSESSMQSEAVCGKRLSRQWRTQVVLLVYLSMATPYQIGFDVSEPQLWGVMFWFTLAMDMYFIVGEKIPIETK